MLYELLDAETGNALGSFDDEGSAQAALKRLVGDSASVVLLELDEEGNVKRSWFADDVEGPGAEKPLAALRERRWWEIGPLKEKPSPSVGEVGLALATLERELVVESERNPTEHRELPRQPEPMWWFVQSHLAMLQRRLSELGWPTAEESREKRLTRREKQILDLLSEGKTTRQIADETAISTNIVRTHIQNILTKLQSRSRLEAIAYWVRHQGKEQ